MKERKQKIWFSLFSLSCVVLVLWTTGYSFYKMEYEWSFGILSSYLWEHGKPGLILQGLWGTFYISAISIFVGFLLGLAVGVTLFLKEPVSSRVAKLYVEIFRNTPVLVQIYLAYFVIGNLVSLSQVQAGIVTLVLFCGAYVGELVRGTLEHFDKGQIEAAKSLGMTPLQVGWHIILPVGLKKMMPALIGLFVSLVKDSSLVSVLGVLDLTKAALNIVAVTFRSFETWFFIAFIYFIVNYLLSRVGASLEQRLSKDVKR